MAYPRAIKPNYGLDQTNVFALNLGTPALAVVDRYVVSVAMGVKTYTLANSGLPGDGLARNVTLTRTVVGAADTPGIITVTGTNNAGATISEVIIPGAHGVEVVGTKAFKTITSIVGSGWVIDTGADTIVVGFGAKIGLPAMAGGLWEYWARKLAVPTAYVVTGYIGAAVQAPTVTTDADEIEKVTFDLSAGTYNGSKRAFVLIAQ